MIRERRSDSTYTVVLLIGTGFTSLRNAADIAERRGVCSLT
jgi:flavin-binding protein dodecin